MAIEEVGMPFARVALVLLVLPAIAVAGTVTFQDDFSGPSIDSAWTVNMPAWPWAKPVDGWNYNFSGGAMNVTDIAPGGDKGHWYSVGIERPLNRAGEVAPLS
jgi:hypothetical protein